MFAKRIAIQGVERRKEQFQAQIDRVLQLSGAVALPRPDKSRMLEKVCKDSQMLADMFVNYDCDLEGPNLFERTVSTTDIISTVRRL
ncbi:hypothetical protein ABZP36_007873 [Zizania latifolia]